MAIKAASTTIIDDDGVLRGSSDGVIVSHADPAYALVETVVNFEKEVFGGSIAGYTSGGYVASTPYETAIERFPFQIDGATATDIGNLNVGVSGHASHSSQTHGFASGGSPPSNPHSEIQKFPFSQLSGTATDIGDLSPDAPWSGASIQSSSNAYIAGGASPPGASEISTIWRFPFQSTVRVDDIGDLAVINRRNTGISSPTHGYSLGGDNPAAPFANDVERFPFSIPQATAVDIGNLPQGSYYAAGHASSERGFRSGGRRPTAPTAPALNYTITHFPFAVNTYSHNIPNQFTINPQPIISSPYTDTSYTGGIAYQGGHSSTTHGYTSGGLYGNPPFPTSNKFTTIYKFSFSNLASEASDVGDLNSKRSLHGGHQV